MSATYDMLRRNKTEIFENMCLFYSITSERLLRSPKIYEAYHYGIPETPMKEWASNMIEAINANLHNPSTYVVVEKYEKVLVVSPVTHATAKEIVDKHPYPDSCTIHRVHYRHDFIYCNRSHIVDLFCAEKGYERDVFTSTEQERKWSVRKAQMLAYEYKTNNNKENEMKAELKKENNVKVERAIKTVEKYLTYHEMPEEMQKYAYVLEKTVHYIRLQKAACESEERKILELQEELAIIDNTDATEAIHMLEDEISNKKRAVLKRKQSIKGMWSLLYTQINLVNGQIAEEDIDGLELCFNKEKNQHIWKVTMQQEWAYVADND